jgi:methionyl-tRNA synthetase
MSAGINLPESIFAHGWWLMSDSKMSKSIGNVVDPINLIDDYGVDPVRYYLMREMVLGQDANFTTELFKSRYNSELANDFGNLLSRITTLINKNFSGKIPNPGNLDFSEMKIKKDSISLCLSFDVSMKSMRLNEAIELVMRFISSVNKYMEQNAPWRLVKEDKDTAGKILYTAGEALRISALLLSPIMPKKTKDILDILNAFDSKEKWGGLEPGAKLKDHNPLFPRIK